MMKRTTGGTEGRDVYVRSRTQWNAVLGFSVLLAALGHLAVFTLWPRMEASQWEAAPDRPVEVIEIEAPAMGDLPPPPEMVIEPPPPLPPAALSSLDVIEPALLPLTEAFVPVVPELPGRSAGDPALSRFIAFAPHMARPQIRNLAEVESFMLDRYKPYNRATGVEGEVVLDLWIDEAGQVRRAGILESSGHDALDRLGLELVRVVVFTPARNGVEAVAVNVAVPILFERVADD